MGLRVRVVQDDCVGTGRCVADAPGAFALDDDELAVALPAAADLPEALVVRIARGCPNRAIVVERDGVTLDLD